jgi:beta-galactosidase
VNGKPVATLDRRLKQDSTDLDIPEGPAQLDILVADDGRVNYGSAILNNHKGIAGEQLTEKQKQANQSPRYVTIGDQAVTGWQSFSLPLPDVEKLTYSNSTPKPPVLFHATFQLDKVGDSFLDMRGWTKGWVWVNGHNLGRYWFIGPQQTLYLPGCWLKEGANSIVVLEQEKLPEKLSVAGLTEPILDQLIKPKTTVAKTKRWKEAPALNTAVASGNFPDTAKPQDVKFTAVTGRYLCLQATSSQKGDNFASAAEIGAFDDNGKPFPRDKWSIVYADSEENLSDDNAAENVLDGDTETIWHTRYNGAEPKYPHLIVIDLGETKSIAGLRYTPRPEDGAPGRIKGYSVYVLPEK